MDKNEYRAKLDEINELMDDQDYEGALQIVDSIDWRRVRSARTLCMAGEIYEANKRYEDSKRLLLLARQRAPIGKTVLYRLTELSIKMRNLEEAEEYYKQFVEVSPNDNNRYILKYKICRASRAPIGEQISILQEYKSREYMERWAYELARLYAKAGMTEACVEECDDLILWFSEGRYVDKALELKLKYAPLSPSQQEKYDKRFRTSTAHTAAGAVNMAAQTAAKILSTARLANEPAGTAAAFAPAPKDEGELQEKAAQSLRDVLSSKGSSGEIAAAREPEAEVIAEDNPDYVVKDLEPENLEKTAEFKPFQFGKNMTMEVRAEAPKSQILEPGKDEEKAFKTDISVQDFDLEALLEETANELAHAVAEEGTEGDGQEDGFTEDLEEETEAEEAFAEKPEEEPAKEILDETEEVQPAEDSGLVAPAAAKAALVAADVAAAVSARAEEIEGFGENEALGAEDKAESETAEGGETEAEEISEAEEMTQEEEPEAVLTDISGEILEGTDTGVTREFPAEEISRARDEIDLGGALEEALAQVVDAPREEDTAGEDMALQQEVLEESAAGKAEERALEGLIRHRLTEEEHRRLFTYFVPVPGMSQQIRDALDATQESACAKTSQAGNIIVMGRQGSGKTRLSEGLVKAICKERQMEGAKVAYLNAQVLNEKDPAAVVGKLSGGFLVVENAGALKSDVIENMSKAMEFKTNRLTVILEDLRQGIQGLEEQYPEFMEKFDCKIGIPVFTNDELVTFAKTYAKELGYKVDDMAVLALYMIIGDNQDEDEPVTITRVREMMDEAIMRASRKGRRQGKKVSKRHLDGDGRIMLYEKDFDV